MLDGLALLSQLLRARVLEKHRYKHKFSGMLGIKEAVLIQEPSSASLARGMWYVGKLRPSGQELQRMMINGSIEKVTVARLMLCPSRCLL